MDPKLEKAFRVSDGLASLAHKKITGMVRELEGEGVLTKEKQSRAPLEELSKNKRATCKVA